MATQETKAYWKIPKEWVAEWGLTGNEALLLADIEAWPLCTIEERAERVKMTKRTIINITNRLRESEKISPKLGEKISPKLGEKISPKLGEKISPEKVKKFHQDGEKISPKKVKNLHQNGEKISPSPHTPFNKEEEHEEQRESARTHAREDENLEIFSKKNGEDFSKKRGSEDGNGGKSGSEIILEGMVDFYRERLDAVYIPDFRVETTATEELVAKVELVMEQERWMMGAESMATFWRQFLEAAYKGADEWQKGHFDIKTLNAQFNNFYLKIKNGNNRNSNSNGGITDDYLERTMREAAGIIQP